MTQIRSTPTEGRTILVVDDRPTPASGIRTALENDGHIVIVAPTGAAALPMLTERPAQVLVIDYFSPTASGDLVIRRARERDPLAQVILLTDYPAEHPPRSLLRRLRVQGYHDRRDGPERLLVAVDVALHAYDQLARLHVSERLKTELLGNVSHEFRTPLNVIAGYVELLREGTFGACTSEAGTILTKVHANTSYLLELVEEFLDLAKLEATTMVAHPEEIQLTPFLRELGESFALLVRTKAVDFVADIPDRLPAVRGEVAKLRVVVQNLLGNAEKFTERGVIHLAAVSLDGRRVAIRVRDTGPGIAPEHQEAVFELFRQGPAPQGRARGAGVGLALARRFARSMGGDILLESAVGRGSVFTVVLPTVERSSGSGTVAA